MPTRQIWEEVPDIKKRWEGIRIVSDSATSCTSYHGALSAAYFTAQINRYLKQELQGSYDERQLQPKTASNTFAAPTSTLERGDRPEHGDIALSQCISEGLTRSQEETFLSLFWQSYHCLSPIVSETELREHHNSLWAGPSRDGSAARRSSALIDIILAICMQYGTSFMASREDDTEGTDDIGSEDTSVAGRGLYARCQRLLEFDLETPSMNTLQSLFFSVIYLQNASFINQADNVLSMAVRTGYMLGLDHEPPETLTPVQQDHHRRLWWTLYLFDTQIGIALGRPFFIQTSTITCSFPNIGSMPAPEEIPHLVLEKGEISLVDYSTHSIRLALSVRGVYSAFDERSSELIRSLSIGNMHEDPKVMENLASLLSGTTKKIQEWAESVPEALRSARKGNNEPFSAHRSKLNIDLHQPPWLQRQQVNLILLYHEFMMGLFRPFIRIPPVSVSQTPLSDGHSISCLNHAMAITSIAHQVLCETDILNGCHNTYRTQLNAAFSILGFILGNPVCPPTPSGRKALQTAASVFDMLGSSFASATSAAKVVRSMSGLAQKLVLRFRESLNGSSYTSRASPQSGPQSQASPQQGQQRQQQQPQPQTTVPSFQHQQPEHQIVASAFQPLQQQSGSYVQPHQLAPQLQPAISMPGEFLPGVSNSSSLLDPTLSYDINGMAQWPAAMSMDITPDMLNIPEAQQPPWSDFMLDVHQEASDQTMDNRRQ